MAETSRSLMDMMERSLSRSQVNSESIEHHDDRLKGLEAMVFRDNNSLATEIRLLKQRLETLEGSMRVQRDTWETAIRERLGGMDTKLLEVHNRYTTITTTRMAGKYQLMVAGISTLGGILGALLVQWLTKK